MYRGESEAAISPPEDKSAYEALPYNDHSQTRTPAILSDPIPFGIAPLAFHYRKFDDGYPPHPTRPNT
jgi:hypothetical protein